MSKRQQILLLYAGTSCLSSKVVGWSFYDGTGKGDEKYESFETPPFETVLDAMKDGWRVIQVPVLTPPLPGHEKKADYLKFEFVLERLEDI